MLGLPNPLNLVNKAIDFAGDIAKGGAGLVGNIVNAPIDLVSSILRPTGKITDGLLDLVRFPGFSPAGGPPLSSSNQAMLNSINSLSDVVNGIKKELENPNLSPEKRQELAFKLQEAMQNRSLMSDLLSTMMKDEFNIASKILRNLGQ